MAFVATLRRLSTINVLGALALIVTFAAGAFLSRQGDELRTVAASRGIVSLELAFTEQQASAVIASWSGEKRDIATRQVWADFIFIAGYGWLAFYLCFKAADRAQRRGATTLATAACAAGFGGLVAGVLDSVENIGMLLMLAGVFLPGIVFVTSIAAAAKFGLLIVGAIVALLAALWPATKRSLA